MPFSELLRLLSFKSNSDICCGAFRCRPMRDRRAMRPIAGVVGNTFTWLSLPLFSDVDGVGPSRCSIHL